MERWTLLRPIGEGATAEVYLARDAATQADVAVKVLRAEHGPESDVFDRFAVEGRALARVRHRNVVRMLARGTSHGRPFIVLEHVGGATLASVLSSLRDRKLALGRALGVLGGILGGLAAIHAAGAMHGDVKPSNVLLGDRRVVLADLGLAHPLGSGCRIRTDVAHGTPRYLAPELALGRMNAPSPATDIYAAGILAFEILTGVPPFSRPSAIGVLRDHIERPVPPPSSFRPELPRAIDEVVLRAVSKDPAQRPASSAEFRSRLFSAMGRAVCLPRHESAVAVP